MDEIPPREAVVQMKRLPKDSIAAGRRHTVGLKSDYTVTTAGNNRYHRCNVSGWCDIVAVAAGVIFIQSDLNQTAR